MPTSISGAVARDELNNPIPIDCAKKYQQAATVLCLPLCGAERKGRTKREKKNKEKGLGSPAMELLAGPGRAPAREPAVAQWLEEREREEKMVLGFQRGHRPSLVLSQRLWRSTVRCAGRPGLLDGDRDYFGLGGIQARATFLAQA